MGLGLRWILSFCLLIVPIAITLGVLFPLQNHHRSSGGVGSFLGDGGGGLPGVPTQPKNNKVSLETTCAQFAGLGLDRYWADKQQQYTFNPNQWGLNSGESSGMCMNVLFNNNGSYAQPDLAPPFQVTWSYPQSTTTNPVHAFPNIKLENVFPKALSTISKLYVDFEWKYVIGSDNTTASASNTLASDNVNTNVAIDMFADNDKTTSENNEKAGFEIMVWFAQIGGATHVIGQDEGVQKSIAITDATSGSTVTFDLYTGAQPSTKQYVMTWKAQTLTEKFHGDLYPLIEYLVTAGNADYPTKDAFLGSFGMGSEAFNAPQNVTFYVPDFAVNVTSS